MQHDDKHISDLDYLAEQGFDKVPVTDADLNDLVKKVKARSFSYNNGIYFGFISLMAGIFIGTSLFFVLSKDVVATLPVEKTPAAIDSAYRPVKPVIATLQLDEITVTKENFIDPNAKPLVKESAQAKTPVLRQVDSVMTIPEKPIDVSLFNGKIQEAKLKFIANAPVMYIHDLKVTNYTILYFRKNHFVDFTGRPGLSADYASKASIGQNAAYAKQNPDYFLHEEVAEALLYFKKGKYDQCINSLDLIATYNDSDLNCDFYLAMCYYYKHNYTKAISLFDKCIDNLNNTFLQEAAYYKAVALYESGNKADAFLIFKEIVDEDGFYTGKAKGYLK